MTQSIADKHRNPTLFTTVVAELAHLERGVDYERGDPFQVIPDGRVYYYAKLLGNPVDITLRVFDVLGHDVAMYRHTTHIRIPPELWKTFKDPQRVAVIRHHYMRNGGTELYGTPATPKPPNGD